MKKFLSKLLFSFIVVVVLFSSFFATPVKAQVPVAQTINTIWGTGPWYNQSFGQFYSKVYDPDTPSTEIFGERYTSAQVDWIIYTILSWPFTKILGPNFIICWTTFDLVKCGEAVKDFFVVYKPA